MDARHLVAMEALAGNGFDHEDNHYFTDPGRIAAVVLEGEFQNFIDAVTVRLLAQSAVSDFLVGVRESPDTADVSDVYSHPFSWLVTLPYRAEINELGGELDGVLNFYVGSHAEGSTPPLSIDNTLALLRMLRIDFGTDETAYRTSVETAFVAAGFEATVAAGYADRVIEPHMRYVNGTDGDDRLKGTSLDDILVGGVGNDTYVWGPGQGTDVTDEEGAASDVDRLVLEGLAPDDVWVTRMSGPGYDRDVLITIKETGERLILDDQLGSDTETIDEVEFAGGVVWNGEKLKLNTFENILVGSDEADTLEGSTGQDYLEGGERRGPDRRSRASGRYGRNVAGRSSAKRSGRPHVQGPHRPRPELHGDRGTEDRPPARHVRRGRGHPGQTTAHRVRAAAPAWLPAGRFPGEVELPGTVDLAGPGREGRDRRLRACYV